ncbi:ABC transporter ATP-binding protein [uncultured Clostridium sp.]|uniref:ABC transporter ATP-binding protein n=1 Tax=uncultured Clostridium sp. TaxID=59620 RepID=UPI0032166853
MRALKIEPMKEPNLIKNYWLKEKKVVAMIIFFGIAFNGATVVGPILQGNLIDSILNKESLHIVFIRIALFIGAIAFIQLARFFKRFYVRRFANSTSATMRLMIYNNIMSKDINELNDENMGSLMTRVISDVDLCVEGMRKVTTEVFDTGVLMIAYLVTMITYDAKITLISCLFIAVAIKLAEVLKGVIYKYSTDYRKESSVVTDLTYDSIENAILFRINGLEDKNREEYFHHLDELQRKAVKASVLENAMQPVYNVIALLGIIIVIYLGGNKVIEGSWTVGNFSTYMVMFTAITTKASKTAKLFNSAQKSRISWLRIKPYLNDYEVKDTTTDMYKKGTTIQVKNLSFSYPNREVEVIRNINFEGKTGEIIGVTGPIASGKSTLGIALLGIYDYKGSIKIDNRELRDYSEYERSEIISYLGHNTQLLSDTIYNNITLGKDKSIKEVLKDVCFNKDLESMEQGENTLVGNSGVRLSGGQQARLSLARALLNKNKVIILDDPFSAIDVNTESEIIHNLRSNYKYSIVIIISHRLTMFNQVDKVIMFHEDKKVECGTHEELINKSELYSTIYKLQRGELSEG